MSVVEFMLLPQKGYLYLSDGSSIVNKSIRSVQLPYSVCETAYSHVGLFLDQPFLLQIRSFHFFWILLKVSLTIAKEREILLKRGFNRKNSHTKNCIKGMPLLRLHMWEVQIKRMEMWED